MAGLPITPFLSLEEAVGTILDNNKVLPGFAVAVNAEKVISTLNNKKLSDCLNSATLLYADGVSVVATIKKKGVSNSRVPGCDLWLEIMRRIAGLDIKVYLLGGKESTSKAVERKLRQVYGVNQVKRRNGYQESDNVFLDDIVAFRPDIIVVALGSPKQELLIRRLRKVYPNGFYMGVGGSFDILAGEVKRAPKIIRSLNMEWLYRLLTQPSRAVRQLSLVKYVYMHITNKL